MRRRIEKKKEYTALKKIRFGEWEPVRESTVPIPLLATLSIASEIAMPNADMGIAKKSVEKKRYPRVVNVLKDFVEATTSTKRILDLGVSLIVGELLAFAPAIEKQPTKAISEDEAVQFRINILESAEVFETSTPYS